VWGALTEQVINKWTFGEQAEKFNFGQLREVHETLHFLTLMQSEEFRTELEQQAQSSSDEY
jgi:hypothetical protein